MTNELAEGNICLGVICFRRVREMRSKWISCVVLSLAAAAFAKDPKPYQTGKLVQMDSVQCATAEKGAPSVSGEMLASDSVSKQTQQLLCQEYVLQTDRVIYRIRPRNEKRPVLLSLGAQAQFRLQKDKLLLRAQDLDSGRLDNKEREYIVISMAPRSDSSSADASPTRLNHLQ
jgi:hypothetical protein